MEGVGCSKWRGLIACSGRGGLREVEGGHHVMWRGFGRGSYKGCDLLTSPYC